MITFLSCNANIKFQLQITIKYQDDSGVGEKTLDIDSDTEYKISVADNDYGLKTYNCRIVSYTCSPCKLYGSYANPNNSMAIADTLTIDYSENGKSNVKVINVSDIRNLEAHSSKGFEEIVNDIPEFK